LLYTAPLPFTGRFYPLGFPLDVAADAPQVLDAVAQSWGAYALRFDRPPLRVHVLTAEGGPALPPAPVFRAQRHLLAIVADQENFAVCDGRQIFGYCFVTRATVADPVFLRWHFLDAMIYMLLELTSTMAVHAACVAWDGAGVLLCGASGAGKSTLAYACARRGWTFVSDDGSSLLLDSRDRTVVGQPHCFRFREDAAGIFPELYGRTAGRELDHKPTIELRTAGLPIRTAPDCRAERIVFLDRRAGAGPRLTPVGKDETRERLLRDVAVLEPEVQTRRLAAIESLLEAPAFELHYDGFEDAVRLLEERVRQGGGA
jgi:hypothetical protein